MTILDENQLKEINRTIQTIESSLDNNRVSKKQADAMNKAVSSLRELCEEIALEEVTEDNICIYDVAKCKYNVGGLTIDIPTSLCTNAQCLGPNFPRLVCDPLFGTMLALDLYGEICIKRNWWDMLCKKVYDYCVNVLKENGITELEPGYISNYVNVLNQRTMGFCKRFFIKAPIGYGCIGVLSIRGNKLSLSTGNSTVLVKLPEDIYDNVHIFNTKADVPLFKLHMIKSMLKLAGLDVVPEVNRILPVKDLPTLGPVPDAGDSIRFLCDLERISELDWKYI